MVAIVGNPNAGKTTLFNALTGSHQKVGNYPGVTVEKIHGDLKLPDRTVDCFDLPGLYSLNAVSEDERVAVDVIGGRSEDTPVPDLIVCVIDSGNLERNLFIYTQLAEGGHPLLVALTMVDRLESKGITVDIPKLRDRLGVEVVPLVGHRSQGLEKLREAIQRNLDNPVVPNLDFSSDGLLKSCVEALRERMARAGMDLTESDVRRGLLFPSPEFDSYLRDFPEMGEAFAQARLQLETATERKVEVAARYRWTAEIGKEVLVQPSRPVRVKSRSDRIDAVLTHRVFGLSVFVGLMYLVFQSIYTFSKPMMDVIQAAVDGLGNLVSPIFSFSAPVQSFLVDGIIKGVGSVLVFLPQILILFFFIAVLEGTGYLARAAFLMDRLLGWCGLNGRAFIPLLSSFACAIPGIMSARVMPDPKSRLATILVAPLMSCSARLPVYVVIIGSFIEPKYGAFWAGFALFAMHFLGLLVAIPIVWLLNRKMLKGKRLPFLLELPPYQWPKWRDVWLAMYFRGKVFLTTAGTIIVAMSAIIWALSYFPRSNDAEQRYRAEYARSTKLVSQREEAHYVQQRQLQDSALGRFGQFLEPAFRPAGFDWRITTSILSAFPARETVVPSLGIIFSLGSEGEEQQLGDALTKATWPDGRPLMNAWNSIGLMVFFALCCQCMSTLATIKRETNSVKWPLFVFSYMTAMAYVAAVIIYQVGMLLSR